MNPIGMYSAWLHTLPLWAQPSIASFIPCSAVFIPLTIRHRIVLHRRGERFRPSKSKPAEMIGGLLFCGALFFLRGRYPAVASVLNWPDRTFPYYRQHGVAIWLGLMAAAFATSLISALFAALFLRGGGAGRGAIGIGFTTGEHTLLPDPPAGFGWFRPPPPTIRRTIITRRTFHTED